MQSLNFSLRLRKNFVLGKIEEDIQVYDLKDDTIIWKPVKDGVKHSCDPKLQQSCLESISKANKNLGKKKCS